jgi:hypothetical protein
VFLARFGRERFSGARDRERDFDEIWQIIHREKDGRPKREKERERERERERDLTARSGRDSVERKVIWREKQREGRRESGGEGEDRFMEKINGCFEFLFLLIS